MAMMIKKMLFFKKVNKEGLRGNGREKIWWELSRADNWMRAPCWEVWALGTSVCQMSLGTLYLQFPTYFFISFFHFPNWTAAMHPMARKLINLHINNLWHTTWNGVQGTMKCLVLTIQIAGGQMLFGRIFLSQKQVCSCPISSYSSYRKSPRSSRERRGRSKDSAAALNTEWCSQAVLQFYSIIWLPLSTKGKNPSWKHFPWLIIQSKCDPRCLCESKAYSEWHLKETSARKWEAERGAEPA